MSEKRNSHQLEGDVDPQLLNGIHYTGNKGPCFGIRHSIIIISAIGFSLGQATKSSFSVVLVAMTTRNTSSNTNIPTYDWDNKGVILSSVMWMAIPVQLIAGHFGKKYGHKWFIMGAVIFNGLFFMLIPAFASFGGSIGVIFCRILQGGALGILNPIVVSVSGLWVPAEERSRNGMIVLGIAFLGGIGGFICAGQIAASSWGYSAYCYLMGGVSFLWCVAWYFVGHQSPATHPSITPDEKKYIETSLNARKMQHTIPTPWLKLLTSLHFWAPVVGAIGTNWIETILATCNLLYITKAWQLDVAEATRTTAAAPFVGMALGIFMAPMSDFLIKKGYIRVVNSRRMFQTIGIIGNSITLLWMTWIPAKSMPLIIFNLCLGNIFTIIFNVGGAALTVLDISPTFSGIISGFALTFGQCFALFAPITIDWFVKDESDPTEWRIIFFITAAISIGSVIFFDIFATDKRQWEDKNEENEKK